MLSQTYSGIIDGITGEIIIIESDVSRGMPYFNIIGLPDTSVKESKDRVRAAIINSHLKFPEKITVNLAPASLKKDGSYLDLGIAVSIMSACKTIQNNNLKKYFFIGELLLSGEINSVSGVLPLVISAKNNGFKYVVVPEKNKFEASVVKGIKVIPVYNLYQTVEFLNNKEKINVHINPDNFFKTQNYEYDFKDIVGQNIAKRGMEIAAAGSHNILLVGPPGTGKTLLAKSLPSILPDMVFEEAIETTRIHSVAGTLSTENPLMTKRLFRNPHHTVSNVSLIGGGANSKPGEVSLAHNGVLFLDEFPEFKRTAIESLRQPIEDKIVTVSRIKAVYKYPSNFILVAAMNGCPCGNINHPNKECNCSHYQIQKYLSKISGPILDRIDMQIEVLPVDHKLLINNKDSSETSVEVKKRVQQARNTQNIRYKNNKNFCNSAMNKNQIKKYCKLDNEVQDMLIGMIKNFNMSIRAYDKILKLSRTIADLENSEKIDEKHILEAVSYRTLDKNKWFETF